MMRSPEYAQPSAVWQLPQTDWRRGEDSRDNTWRRRKGSKAFFRPPFFLEKKGSTK